MTDDVFDDLLDDMKGGVLQTLAWPCPRRCGDPQSNEIPRLATRGGRP